MHYAYSKEYCTSPFAENNTVLFGQTVLKAAKIK